MAPVLLCYYFVVVKWLSKIAYLCFTVTLGGIDVIIEHSVKLGRGMPNCSEKVRILEVKKHGIFVEESFRNQVRWAQRTSHLPQAEN